MHKSKSQERLGQKTYNNNGTLMKIIEYNNIMNIIVEFQDKHKTKVVARYEQFLNGKIANPYDKTVHKIGYLGIGKYNQKDHYEIYKVWNGLIQRCYDPYFLDKHPTYRDCMVCEEWHNFQNFAKWYEENYYKCNNETMELDKDILIKGNKIYSPETCIFVPNRINLLFCKRQNDRGKYPIGVTEYYDKRRNYKKLMVQINTVDKRERKYFSLDKPFQTFTYYKEYKENYIKQIANEYKNLIPIELYNALYSYKVEIND